VKAALDRGLAAPLPTAWQSRLLSALAARFPAYRSFRLYTSRERALAAASRVLGAAAAAVEVADPGLGTRGAGRVGLWRPFLPGEPDWPVLLPVLPLTLGARPRPPASATRSRTMWSRRIQLPASLPSGRCTGWPARAGSARRPVRPRDLDGCPGWERRGPYLGPVFAAAAYREVFRAFLARGVLLSPLYPGPSILPGEASEGEWRLLASLFHSIPKG